MAPSLAATACLGVAAALVAAGGCGDEIDRRPATWGYISPALMQPNCATVSCHGAAAAAAGLDLSDPERGYRSLTGLSVVIPDPMKPEVSKFRPLVVPYNPDQSRVVHMLRATNAARMPPDRPLSEADIALIERWILNGAKKVPDSARPPAIDASSEVRGDAGGDVSVDSNAEANVDTNADAGVDTRPDADAASLDVASGG